MVQGAMSVAAPCPLLGWVFCPWSWEHRRRAATHHQFQSVDECIASSPTPRTQTVSTVRSGFESVKWASSLKWVATSIERGDRPRPPIVSTPATTVLAVRVVPFVLRRKTDGEGFTPIASPTTRPHRDPHRGQRGRESRRPRGRESGRPARAKPRCRAHCVPGPSMESVV